MMSTFASDMSTTTATATATTNPHDEYSDYSCSTSLERLARDVETRLRAWHVDHCDRHATITLSRSCGSNNDSGTNNNSKNKNNTGQQGETQRIVSVGGGLLQTDETIRHQQPQVVTLIRSDIIEWNVSFYVQQPTDTAITIPQQQQQQRISCPIQLELVLWDGPSTTTNDNNSNNNKNPSTSTAPTTLPSRKSNNNNKNRKRITPRRKNNSNNNKYNRQSRNNIAFSTATVQQQQQQHLFVDGDKQGDDDDDDDYDDHNDDNNLSLLLPFSLQRNQSSWPLANDTLLTDLFENFSTLFGIGQHITLSPLYPHQPLSKDLLTYLVQSVADRQYDNNSSLSGAVVSILTTWLQSALNMAAAYSQCSFPVMGIWGKYQPTAMAAVGGGGGGICGGGASSACGGRHFTPAQDMVLPSWCVEPSSWLDERQLSLLLLLSSSSSSRSKSRNRQRRHTSTMNGASSSIAAATALSRPNSVPAVLAGQLRSEDCTTTFSCYVLQPDQLWMEPAWQRWTTWGSVLQRHVGNYDRDVHLWTARHVYAWFKPALGQMRGMYSSRASKEKWAIVTAWRKQHQAEDPFGGEDVEAYRLQCRQVALSLLERASGVSDAEPLWGPADDPLASLHVIVTWSSSSSNSSSSRDEKREPLLSLPPRTRSRISMTEEDRAEVEDSLEASVLNPVGCSSFFVRVYFDPEAAQAPLGATQRCVLAALIRAATLPRETLLYHLIDENIVSRWDSEAGNRIATMLATRASVDDTTHALVTAMDWSHAVENMIDTWQADGIVQKVMDARLALEFPGLPINALKSSNLHLDGWKALLKSAPPGRLLSLLFVQMANVRSPPSMALVWKSFTEELRRRGESNESLPNMDAVPGLDPPLDPSSAKQCFSTVGTRASFAAHVNCSEPEPDDYHCLIGQKLQAFNVCVESITTARMREVEQAEKRPKLSSQSPPRVLKRAKSCTLLNGSIVDGVPIPEGQVSPPRSVDGTQSGIFYDAKENESFLDADMGNFGEEIPQRRGARCPVQGSNLIQTGDQVYAPYLQRPQPLTDDIIAQRQMVLAQQQGPKARSTLLKRLEITHRLQKPKLLSDMQAFKAANPGAVFQDFVSWYGNPDNPLVGVDISQLSEEHLGDATMAPTKMKLDRAAEAIRVLDRTRQFWSDTWGEAQPLPAAEQDILFDASSTIEMIIDHLETIHPATLLCQVMAVNLAMAYFSLVVSAGDAVEVEVVHTSLVRFRESVETALELLSYDVTFGDQQPVGMPLDDMVMFVSVESLYACGRACLALSEAEILVSRATSLLHKLPQQYTFVNTIMIRPNGTPIKVADKNLRSCILKATATREKTNGIPIPSTREYVLMNDDDLQPFHLSVRYSDNRIIVGMTKTVV